jgi:co-chaperonin GroES (HSP10)
MPTIKPAFNRLLLKPVPSDSPIYGEKKVIVAPTGILPEDIQSLLCEVVAIPDNAIQFKVGDLVFPAKGSLRDGIAHNGEKYVIANESEILGVLITDEVNF